MRDVAKMYNKPYPWDTRIRILGTTEQMTAKIAVNDLKLPITVDEFRQKFCELGRKRLQNVGWLRGSVYGKIKIPERIVEQKLNFHPLYTIQSNVLQ